MLVTNNKTLCKCCFDDVDEYITCTRGHALCKNCVILGIDNAIGEHKIFGCVDESKCKGTYYYNRLFRFVTDKRKQNAYKKIKKPKKEDDVKTDVKDPTIVYCCVPMVLGDACNKLTCPKCFKYWCWSCKSRITEQTPYDHYKKGHCQLYGEPSKKHPVERPIQVEQQEQVLRIERQPVRRRRRQGQVREQQQIERRQEIIRIVDEILGRDIAFEQEIIQKIERILFFLL
jgi:hypothetical protein